MTDQPTDHRAEAEQWLARTERLVGPDEDDETMTIMLSFAHWLGAIHDALLAEPAERILERRMEALAQLFTAGGPMPTAPAIRAALRGEPLKDHGADTVYRVTPPNPEDVGTTTWHGNQMHRFHVPPPSPPESPKICTHREHVHGVEKGCAMWANHPGEHRLTVFSPAPHPPLSPSEG